MYYLMFHYQTILFINLDIMNTIACTLLILFQIIFIII